jgi:DNA-directed RNA polymerase subunit RPC12/RpoP
MICTECKKEVKTTYAGYWYNDGSKNGIWIINEDEHLCPKCASKRTGFRTLSEINNSRKLKKLK